MKLLGLFGILELVVLTQVADGEYQKPLRPTKPCPPGHTHQIPDSKELATCAVKFVFETKCSECDRTMEELTQRLQKLNVQYDSYLLDEENNKKSGKCSSKMKSSICRLFPSIPLESISPITPKPKPCSCVVPTTKEPVVCTVTCPHTHHFSQDLMDHPENYLFRFGCPQCDATLKLLCKMKNKEKNGLKVYVDTLTKKILHCWY